MKNHYKISFTAITVILLLVVSNIYASVWRVNNKAGTDADFSSPLIANNDASVLDGDTLLVEGSTVSYGDVTFTKKLVVIGPGYFLAQNPETQANLATAMIENTVFNAGSDSSLMIGMHVINTGNGIAIYTNAVTIKRCLVEQKINIEANDVMLLQNYINYSSSSYHTIDIPTNYSTVIIQNNFISGYSGTSSTSYQTVNIEGTSIAILSNNVIYGSMELVNSTVSNNIWRSGLLNTNVGNTYSNNICNSTQFPAGTNMQGVDMVGVFKGTGTADGQWMLSDTSVALGYGIDSVDCGMYGGVDPYVLSGMPPIPSIYYFNAPSTASTATGLPVSIKIKSHK